MPWFYIGRRMEAEGMRDEAIAAYRQSVELRKLPDADQPLRRLPIAHPGAMRGRQRRRGRPKPSTEPGKFLGTVLSKILSAHALGLRGKHWRRLES